MKIDFKLSADEIVLSKRIFNDKIVRIIISNGALTSADQVSKTHDDNTTIVFFPENNLSIDDSNKYVEKMCKLIDNESLIIITNSYHIITAAPKCLCKIAKYKNENPFLDDCGVETFAQNLFNILFELTDQSMSSTAYNFINIIIQKLNDKTAKYTPEEKEQMRSDINLIGEEIIRNKMLEMLNRSC